MKKVFQINVLVITLLIVSVFFVGCNKKVKTTKTITSTAIAEEINEVPIFRESIAFITGVDSEHSNYYSAAKKYFEDKQFEVVTEAFSLEEIIIWLNNNYDQRLYSEIHIISENTPWNGMKLETIIRGEIVKENTLRDVLINDRLPKLKNGIVKETNVVFHSSALANNLNLVKALKHVFSSNVSPKITTTPYYTIFGSQFSEYYLAIPYYAFYPTAYSTGKVDLSKEFAKNYPKEKGINWLETLYNESERFVGEAYTIKFNVPVEWTIDYSNSDKPAPTLKSKEQIIEWISENESISNEISNYNIPLEKFRWSATIKNDKLIIKGKTTVVCILKPIIKPYGNLEHVVPEIDNMRLYNVE